METTAPRFPLTVMVLTLDEAVNIAACLRSVAWADEVVVVDSGSTDGTLEMARSERPDARVFTRPFTDFGDQRTWAIDNTAPRHEWILFLDADERCDDACAAAIRSAVRGPAHIAGYFLSCRNHFLGRWLKHAAISPSWQLRLFRKGAVRYRKEGHGQREVTDGPLAYLKAPYDHYGFSKGLHHWVARHNDYTTAELELVERLAAEPVSRGELFGRDPILRRRALKKVAARHPWLRLFMFHYLFLARLGFLDGRAGLVYCLLRLVVEVMLVAKIYERRLRP